MVPCQACPQLLSTVMTRIYHSQQMVKEGLRVLSHTCQKANGRPQAPTQLSDLGVP